MSLRALPLLLCSPLVALALPAPVTLQTSGYLLDAADAAVNSEGLTLAFSLWSDATSTAAGDRVWTATPACSLEVRGGYFAAALGASSGPGACGSDLDTSHLPTGEPRWLEVSVGSVRLLPRQRVAVAPGALVAAYAADAGQLGGLDKTAFALASHTHTAAQVTDFSTATSAFLGPKAPANPRHHDRYTDAEAVAAVQTADVFAAKAHTHPATDFSGLAPALVTLPFDCPYNQWISGLRLVADKVVPVCSAFQFLGQTAENAAESCQAIRTSVPGASDGQYFLDPDGAGTSFTPFLAYCDIRATSGGNT